MKSKRLFLLLLAATCILSIGMAYASETPGSKSGAEDVPVAFLPERSYSFQPVPEGTQITHGFTLQNKGTAPLLILDVRTG
jgi:hypothetical protein